MDARHARFPFLDGAREAVEETGVSLVELVAEDHPAVERGRERVERALVEGSVATDRRVDARTELLSYPIARVLVSLLDAPGAVEKYAAAEAATAAGRFTEAFESGDGRQATLGDGFTVETFLGEFGLDSAIRPAGDDYRVAVDEYLRLAPAGASWRLVVRELADGRVTVSRPELYDLLRSAAERRVADGLPLSVPAAIADPLEPVVASVESAIAGADSPRSFDAVDPAAFPPCVTALLDRVRDDEETLSARSRFSLVAFLAAIGADAEGIAALCDTDDDGRLAYAADRLAGDGSYPPPSCATMQAYGDCVNQDDLCATIDHPLEYYAARLDGERPDGTTD